MSIAVRTVANRRVKVRNYPYSINCNGVDGYIAAQINGFLPSTNAGSFSIAFWFSTTINYAADQRIMGYQKTGNATFFTVNLNHNNSGSNTPGKIGMFLRDNDNEFENFCTNAQYQFGNGRWHHMVITGTPNISSFSFYLDGVKDAGTIGGASGVMDKFSDPISPYFLFGALNNNGSASSFAPINFAEILMYESELTQTQVTELYFEGTIPAGPFRYYKCDEGTGTTINDSSSNNIAATLVVPTTGGWTTNSPMKSRNVTT